MAIIETSAGARLYLNPAIDRARAYGETEQAILSLAKARVAHRAIKAWPGYQPTPLRPLPALARALRVGEIVYKDEGERFDLKSFKALGGAYAVERIIATRGGAEGLTVTAATDGNHGRSVAWGAKRFGARAVIFVHETVSPGRVQAIEAFGAEVRRVPGHYDDAVRACALAAETEGWVIVSDTSWPGYETIPKDVMQGYAIIAMEAEAQGARPTHVFVQGGVGGLAAGVLSYRWERYGAERPILVVVEPERAACLFESAKAGEITAFPGDLDTVMAGLACGEPSLLAWSILRDGVDAFMTIPDERAVEAMRLVANHGIVGGESGVAGLAGLRAVAQDPAVRAALKLDANARILVYGTEGATDPAVYRSLVGRTPEQVARQSR